MRAKETLLEAIYDAAVSLHGHGVIDTPRLKIYEALCLGRDPSATVRGQGNRGLPRRDL